MWSHLAFISALTLHVTAHAQKPLSFGSSPHVHIKPVLNAPGFGAPTLGDSFIKFAASEIDVSVLKSFVPRVTSLDALSEDTFTTLSHPAYPRHGVRVKKSKFCDGLVDAYTGYVDVEARHIFFSFFKSRGDWEKDPVMMWTNGGPGCSSAIGLFMELGPCRISDETGPKHFDHSWNEHTNIFFVDQPIGVGFSYADHGETVSTTEEAAIDIAFLSATFFEHFSELKGREFHMAGESYGGRYIPLFASAVHDLNPRLEKAGFAPVNLSSILIGNGLTDLATMTPSYYDMQCTPASVPPILDISTCVRMKQAVPRCEKMVKKSCQDIFDGMGCTAAMMFCQMELGMPFVESGMNPYDISKKCDGSIAETLCYPVTKHISNYLSLPSTRKMLGVDDTITGNFSSCSNTVGLAFAEALDIFHPTYIWVGSLLERGVRTLIYVGEYDWICNWVGNARWVEDLDWTGGDGYRATPEGTWSMGNKTVGRARSYGDLTFTTIRGAGHMVPYDKPKEALEMVRKWLAKEEF